MLCIILMIWWSRRRLQCSVMIQTATEYTPVWQYHDLHRALGLLKLLNSRRRHQAQSSERAEATEKRQLGNAEVSTGEVQLPLEFQNARP